ncbi:lipid-A-disaccharide synthase [Desulfovibrio aminophilus]|nr:lipid-A-disaccharide synthase [Desulfovibrio aminophilus]MCM0756761.1 lipid-A-disaccharide synthase [Desulfovibrio aminophilus]
MGENTSIWISAGEASGDLHGALLAKALLARNPGLSLAGMGGSAMREAGVDLQFSMRQISLVGGTEILTGLPRILKLLRDTRRAFETTRPSAVVVIDCPDFHFHVVRRARALGIPVYYFVSPQVWAWRSGRVEFLRKNVRKVLCILPFEKEFYRLRGMDADYVGHPLLDQIPLAELDRLEPEPGRVGILPGSRRKEIEGLLPEFAEAARLMAVDRPGLSFSLVRAPGVERDMLQRLWPGDLDVDIVEPGDRYAAMRRSQFLLAASGTVSLEAALIGTPTVIAYKLSGLSYFLARRLINVKFIGLPNLILDAKVFPELIQEEARAPVMAAIGRMWLSNGTSLAVIREELARLRGMVGEPGAADRAAGIVLDDLKTL